MRAWPSRPTARRSTRCSKRPCSTKPLAPSSWSAASRALRIFELDAASGKWADKVRFYPIEDPSHSIGDFNMIDENRALVIERDQERGRRPATVATRPPRFKRIYLVNINEADADGVIKKIGYIDLLDIQDPDGARAARHRWTASSPSRSRPSRMWTWSIRPPSSSPTTTTIRARPAVEQGRADDNEFMLLDVADLLKAE